MKSGSVLLVALSLVAVGCNPGSSVTSRTPPAVSKKPAFLRFINLTSEAADIDLDTTKTLSSFDPDKLTASQIISPKKHKISGTVGTKSFSGTIEAEQGHFITCALVSSGGKVEVQGVKGESSETPESGANVEVINLTNQKISFTLASDSKSVDPKKSSLLSVSGGPHTVDIKGAGKVDFTSADREVWGVCVIEKGGKLSAHSIKLKAPMKAVAGGGPSAAS